MSASTCVLIGDSSVLARCGEILLAKGHRITAVLTGDPAIRAWAVKAGLPQRPLGQAGELDLECDFLFSIGNYAIVPDSVLARVRRLSVNYHYGPLPEYAGLNAPSWAIAEQAAEYAISWHAIGELVDGGDVLARVPVPISADDTALTLGVTCDEAAVASFGALVDDLVEGRATATAQDPARRRYFSRHTQPEAEGLLDWGSSAAELAAQVRAADHGPFDSPLVWPKMLLGGRLVAIREAHADEGQGTPGEVLSCDERGVRVATAAGALTVTRLSTLTGDDLAPSVAPGTVLVAPDPDIRERLTALGVLASKSAAHWRSRLTDESFPTRLPYPAPAAPDSREIRVHLAVDSTDALAGAVATFLGRALGTDRVGLATAADRAGLGAEYRDLFLGWLPVRAQLDAGRTVAQNLAAVGREFADARSRAWLRRDSLGRSGALRTADVPEVAVTSAGNPLGAALELCRHEDGTVEFRYDPQRFSGTDVARLAEQLASWCERLALLADQPLGATSTLSDAEHAELIEGFNATADPAMLGRPLPRLVEAAVAAHPEDLALICGDASLTYRQLNAEANRLAHLLRERGIGRGELVGVALDRSLDLVITLLAVAKTGAAYVPIDPAFPVERIRQMVSDADPALIVTPASVPANLAGWADRCLSPAEAAGQPEDDPGIDVRPDDLAYVIYTSGSTGRPKGVEITHESLGNFLSSMRQAPGCGPSDRLLAVTTISFDIAVLELFLPLSCGAATVIAQAREATDAAALLELMRRHEVTMMQGTPATWQLLLAAGWHGEPRLATVLCGGEALTGELADRLLGCGDAVWNLYGPTETTVWSSAWQVRPGADVVIGAPIANTQLYVLSDDLAAVPAGFPGELCIGGAGVAAGYRNDPARTAARFVPNPFGPGSLYRTGDLARFRAPGELTVLGRADGQVKLRGYRIELGDVEAAVSAHPAVARTVVVGRNEQLVAYCVRQPGDVSPDHQAALAEWAGAWDSAYTDEAYTAEPTEARFNLAGWRDSYDGSPFTDAEMREWQAASVRRVLSYQPQRVFEIGSGTGLMLFGIAPQVTAYHAVDASERAVALTRAQLGDLPQASVEHRAAHELPEVAPGSYDTVVINSVAQYFPSLDYLTEVVGWAIDAVGTGRVYLGDVRDLSLLEVFHADLADFRAGGTLTAEELAARAAQGARSERELLVAPGYFAGLSSRVGRVEVRLRDGRHVNEMTRYRYDVVLHVGSGTPTVPTAERAWSGDARFDGPVRLLDVPNGRLREVHARVADALGDSWAPQRWADPQELADRAAEAGLELALVPARSGNRWCLDAVLWHAGDTPDLAPAAHPGEQANVPVAGAAPRASLGQLLRPWLAERLPGYMVPAFFVEMDEFPRTPNGKLDRAGLPDPVRGIEVGAKPATELEHDILAVWSEVLGHDRIGITDNFFEIGGDSLRVVRVATELSKRLGRSISPARLFEHFTVRALAADLAGASRTAPQPVPARRRAAEDEAIAIIGMACRLPGGVTTPEEYWELLERGGDGIVEVPKERWDAAALYDPDPEAQGKSYCSSGGFVTPVDLFDAAFFGISPREARSLDPMQRMILETSWEAFERAGYTMDQLRGSLTGAFIGVGKSSAYHEYGLTMAGGLTDLDGYVGPGSAGGTMSGRVSYVFGLEGPTITLDTACSSSLVTTHLACNALRNGECDLAVSGGVSLMLSPELHVEFSRLRGMSPDGRCRSFSADTEGTGWSEGSAAVILKRLSDAQRDGDPILAVLRGTAVNHDGHAASLTTPSGPAQQRVIRAALAASDLQPADIDYIEAHGTGTKLGDPIEGTALADVFGGSHPDQPLWIGSVKSNLGHTQAAAGLAGVLKVVLAMRHDRLPRTLHVTEPTPAVDWAEANLALLQEERPWHRTGAPRRAGVSSFGIGGTNAHVVVEEPPAPVGAAAEAVAPLPPTVPVLISGNTDAALRKQAETLHLHMGMNIQDRVGDVARSLATTRSHFRRRLALLVKDKSELLDKLGSFARTGELPAGAVRTGDHGEPRLAMLFTGQGSQLPGMGREAYETYPAYRAALDEVVGHFTELDRPLLQVMWAEPGSDDAALLDRTDFTQPALFAVQVALWRLWQSWGVVPEFVLGHSIGEFAAAHVAGILDLADACRLVAARGRLMQALPTDGEHGRGAMASVEASAAETAAAIEQLGLAGALDVAGLNTPTQTVVSGDAAAVERLVAHVAGQGRKAKRLTVSHAFHSHHMDGMLAAFRQVAETVTFHPASVTVVSSLTGELAGPGELARADYWVRQVRQAVRFADGMQTLHRQGVNTFLELGPQPVLSGLGAACLDGQRSPSWIPSLQQGKDAAAVLQRSLAELHVLDVPIDWRGYFAPFGGDRVALPTYAFQRERFWFEPPPAREIGAGLTDTGHVLLGGGVRIAGTELAVYTNVVTAQEPVWVQEHRVMDAVLLPGTAFFEAMRAAGDATEDGDWDLADVLIVAPLVLGPGVRARLQVTVGPASGGGRPVQVYSAPEGEDGAWQLHAEGRIVPRAEHAEHRVSLPPREAQQIDASALYADLAALGYGYGPTFQGIGEAWHVGGEVWARAALPESAEQTAIRYGLHPALLDSAMHSLLLTQRLQNRTGDDLFVPYEAERLTLREPGLAEIWVRVADFELGDGEFWASLEIYNSAGVNVGRLHRLHARRMDRAALRRLAAAGVDRFQFDVTWRPVDIEHVELGGSWGLLSPAGDVPWAKEARTALARAGIQAIRVTELDDAEDLDGLLCLWDAAGAAPAEAHRLTAPALALLHQAAEAGFQPPLVFLTRNAVGTGADDEATGLGGAPLWGLLRTARNEHPELTLRLIDLGGDEADRALLAPAVMLAAEPECALRYGQVLVPQLQRVGAGGELELPAEGGWQLEIAAKGRLDEPLAVKPLPARALAAGEIRAQVKATGVNFLDVLNALGMVEIPAFGLEFAGVVTEVGSAVKDLRVGDPVLGLARGSFAAEVVVDARLVVRMPERLSFAEAATVPMTFLTAWYGLHELGGLRPGERVLIHAAAGGVGMAAVQLARLHGAEVYGTASEPKWPALRELGLAEDHIASSRDLGFVRRFGGGFDVVLNSLATEFIDASLGLLGSGGRFLEMGKIDLRQQSWIDEHHPGVTYTVYNLPEAGPDLTHTMLVAIAALFADGRLDPLPLRTFGMAQTSEALRFMAQARHVGKVVLVPSEQRAFVRTDGAVLITGGLGDLGRRVAQWLVTEHGVQDLVLTSRRGPQAPGADAAVAELAALGAKATVLACDSSDRDAVAEVLAGFGPGRPLRGVVHAAGVLDDGALSALTPERCAAVFRPKLDGAWHLHELTRDADLDLFLLFSSIASVLGAPGQGNYAAANAFLDSLAHLRRAGGLPATSVAWGPWEGDGMAAGLNEFDRARFAQLGLDRLAPDEGLELLERAVRGGRPLTMAAAFDLSRLQRYYEDHGGIPPLFRSLMSANAGGRARGAGAADLRTLLGDTPAEEQEALVLATVREEVAKTLGFGSPDDVDVHLPLQDIGIDSLTAVLMRNQLADLTGLALPAKIAFDHPNLKALGAFLLAKLLEAGVGTPGPAAPAAPAEPALAGPAPAVAARPDLAGARKGCLAPELRFDNAAGAAASPESVFVTGATGFVGAFLLHELLGSGIVCYCLVRADDPGQGMQRLVSALDAYGLWREEFGPLLNPVAGDLAQPRFGLTEQAFEQLAGQVDAICHSGALVDWMRPLADYLGPNVVGTHEVLRLAAHGRGKTVHLVSTFATLPRYLGYEVSEDDREYGYLTSKWMAEQLVAAARWRGARAAVYRLPFVAAAAGSGHFRLDRGDFLHNLIVGALELGSFPALPARLTGVLPVDYLSRTIAELLAGGGDSTGRDWDFVNAQAPTFEEFFAVVGAVGGGAELLPFAEWRDRALAHAAAHPTGALARIAAVLDGLTEQSAAYLLEGLPPGANVLGGDRFPAPPVDERFVRGYLARIEGAEAGAAEPALA
ncbi:MAG TPA: amino acid adenylation domain-containing protein [Jatrophihabitans sp.]|nr:amino acid adenylation domain-containing protein [Jatrophihabitans sp.]